MKKHPYRVSIIAFLLVLPLHINAQNLVPNPGFEEYDCLPNSHGNDMVYCAPPWFTSPHSEHFYYWSTGTPDYFNNNMEFDYVWTENYEPPQPRTGDGSVSFIPVFESYAPIEGYDYVSGYPIESIQVQLTEPMTVGLYYDISFYVTLPGLLNFEYVTHLGTDELGVYFHTDTIYTQTWIDALTTHRDSIDNVIRLDSTGLDGSGVAVPYFCEYLQEPDLELNQLLIEMGEWVRVDTVMYADKPYEYMYFGQFNWYTEINTIDPDPTIPGYDFARVIIDDVSVSLHGSIKETAQTGNDTTLCIGESMVLASHDIENYIYHWSDSHGNEWDIANPTVTPDTTTTYYLSVKDYTFTETFDTLHIEVVDCDSIGVQEFEGFSVELYPNPASSQIHIESPYAINSWKLIDAVGQEVASSKYLVSSANLNIDVSAFKAGLYFLELNIEGVKVMKQVLVE